MEADDASLVNLKDPNLVVTLFTSLCPISSSLHATNSFNNSVLHSTKQSN